MQKSKSIIYCIKHIFICNNNKKKGGIVSFINYDRFCTTAKDQLSEETAQNTTILLNKLKQFDKQCPL